MPSSSSIKYVRQIPIPPDHLAEFSSCYFLSLSAGGRRVARSPTADGGSSSLSRGLEKRGRGEGGELLLWQLRQQLPPLRLSPLPPPPPPLPPSLPPPFSSYMSQELLVPDLKKKLLENLVIQISCLFS